MRSISEFIQEQETGVSTAGTDNLVAAYCECAIATSLANSYLEQAQIALFATEYDTHVVQEANIFTNIGTAIKKAWEKFWTWLKSLFKNVGRKATEEKVADMIDALLGVPNDTELTNVDLRIATIGYYTTWMNERVQEIKAASRQGLGPDLTNTFDNAANDADNFAKDGSWKAIGVTADAATTYLDSEGKPKSIKSIKAGDLKKIVAKIETKNITKTINEAIKHIDDIEKSLTEVSDTAKRWRPDTKQAAAYDFDEDKKKFVKTGSKYTKFDYGANTQVKGDAEMSDISDTTKVREATDVERKTIEAMRRLTDGLTKGYDRALADFKAAYGPTSEAIRKVAGDAKSSALDKEKRDLGYKESYYFV